MATTQPVTDWKKEWFEIEDAAYLNTANHAAMPRVPCARSELFLEIFGERGAHARSTFGSAQIPFGACVEIDLIAEVIDRADAPKGT